MRILLVEDDFIVRKGIVCSLDWDAYGLEICGEAANGRQALERMEEVRPDILITDIRMPIMDGLELAKRVREKYRQIKIVILSGYDDFEYARQAIRIGVQEYLLKPVDADKLLEIISRLKTEIEKEIQEDRKAELRQQLLDGNFWLIQGKLARKLTSPNQEKNAGKETVQKLEQMGIDFSLPKYQAMILRVNNFRLLTKRSSMEERDEIIQSIRESIRESFYQKENIVCFLDDDFHLVILRNFRESGNLYEAECVRKIQYKISGRLGFSITVSCGLVKKEVGEIPASYQEAGYALWNGTGREDGVLLRYCPGKQSDQGLFLEIRQEEQEFIRCLRGGQKEEMLEQLEKFFRMAENAGHGFWQTQYACIRLVMTGIWNLEEIGISRKTYQQEAGSLVSELNQCETYTSLKGKIRDFFSNIWEAIGTEELDSSHLLIRKAVKYVENHYGEEIQVKTLAEELEITPNYFSQIFKAQMGENFIDYLNKFRVKKARKLLDEPGLKIYQISELVGYSNYKYFNQIFRKYMGCTPKEYRNLPGSRRVER